MSISKKPLNWLLLFLVLFGGTIRLLGLAHFPAGFTPDEAAFGYNAYSLLLTGKDEWGMPAFQLFLHNLRSFGDYKLPLYAFLAVPSVKIFGLTEFATRLPNAIFGTLAIISIFLLARQLFPKDRRLAIFAAFLVTISPWHISLSRGAFEANLVTLFLPLVLVLLSRRHYLFSAIILAVNLYSYHSARLVAPFVLVVYYWFFLRPLRLSKKLLLPLFIFVLLSLPAATSYLGAGQGRLSDVSILHPTDNWSGVSERRFADRQAGLPDSLARLFSNKLTYTLSELSRNYLSYFSPQFLFTQGAGEATYGMIPGQGLFFLPELLFLLTALYLVARQPSRLHLGLLALVLVAPLPAIAAKGLGFSANRAAPMFPFLILLMAMGWDYLCQTLTSRRRLFPVFLVSLLAVYLWQTAFFTEDYLYHAPRLNAPAMSYGWAEAVSRFRPISTQYSQIKISRSFSESQIFIAFYWPISPEVYQQASQTWADFPAQGARFLDQLDGYYLGNIRFGNLYPEDPISASTLYIGRPDEFPPTWPYYFQIYSPTGQPVIQVSARQS